MLRILLAGIHLLALGIGLGAVLTRGSLLRQKVDAATLRLVLRYDTIWGIAAILWLSTGLWRLFGATEKATAYYWANHLFLTKMALFLLVVALETRCAMKLNRWRRELRNGGSPDSFVKADEARGIATVSHIEATVVVIMVMLAVAVARGFGAIQS